MTDQGASPPTYRARIEPRTATFPAPADQTLLAAAARVGLELSSSCRNGTCRTCICRLLEGQVNYRIEWPGLLPEEKAQGFILPCVAYPQSDVVLKFGSLPTGHRNGIIETL
ncbi:MAG: 2Fe-2S iron-sulfur cluster binding domain-containing protein [Ramlibacter sp.]|nr:2Fe-2S iron-sulfur cluster binding domain-containing protein [Ramlibacter sp.]